MPKFKVGDKVRVIESALPGVHTGWEDYIEGATVVAVSNHLVNWPYTIKAASGEETLVAECEIELQVKRDYVADHARRTLRKAGLSKEEAAAVVRNWASQDHTLSQLSRSLPAALSSIIISAFSWGGSPEGFDYWNAIFVRESQEEMNA